MSATFSDVDEAVARQLMRARRDSRQPRWKRRATACDTSASEQAKVRCVRDHAACARRFGPPRFWGLPPRIDMARVRDLDSALESRDIHRALLTCPQLMASSESLRI